MGRMLLPHQNTTQLRKLTAAFGQELGRWMSAAFRRSDHSRFNSGRRAGAVPGLDNEGRYGIPPPHTHTHTSPFSPPLGCKK